MENYDSDYSVRLATLEQMGGDMTKHYDSVYEIDLEILKLTEEGGGGAAIKDVDELPDAAENKDKIVRLSTDGKLYAPYLKSRTTTSTNRLPDEQQIDKAYLFQSDNIYYYKGSYKVIFTDGEIEGYGWFYENGETLYIGITKDDAVNISFPTSECISISSEDAEEIDTVNKVITINDTIENWGFATLEDYDFIPIPAIYNAPEANQIGNAYVSDSNYGVIFTYTGEEVEFTYDEETKVGYKWLDSEEGLITISSKRAADIYYTLDVDDNVISDIDWYIDNDGVIEPYEEIPVQLYIPQLNAPDSEQVGNADIYSYDIYLDAHYIYTGEQVEITAWDNGYVNVNAYLWAKRGTDGKAFEWAIFTHDNANNIYSTSGVGVLSNEELWWNTETNHWESTYTVQQLEAALIAPLENTVTEDFVKFKISETKEVWDWELLDKEQEPAILSTESLPSADENTDKFFRTNNDGKLYAAKITSSYQTNKLPDNEQVDKAYLYGDSGNVIHYYKGAYKVICSDGEFSGYGWYTSDDDFWYMYISEDNALEANDNTIAYFLNNEELSPIELDMENRVITIPEMTVAEVKEWAISTMSEWGVFPIAATYNVPEESQIGNATFTETLNSESCVYDGTQVTIIDDVSGEEVTAYKWISLDDENSYVATSKPASEIYFDVYHFEEGEGTDYVITDVKVWYVNSDDSTEGTQFETDLYIPQLNAPDAEQVNVAKIHDTVHNADYIYTGEQVEIICDDNVSVPAYKWVSSGSVEWDTIFSNAADTCYSSIPNGKFDDDDINIYDGQYYCVDASSILIGQINSPLDDNQTFEYSNLIKYQRTQNNYGWKELIPDEIRIGTSGDITVDGNGKINGVQNLSFGDYDVDSLKTLLGEVKELKTDIALVMPVGGLDTTFTCQGMMSLLTLSAGGMDMPMLLITFPFLNMSVQKMDKLTIYYDYTSNTWYIESLIDTLS